MRTLVPIRPWGVISRLLLGVDATTKASLPWPETCINVEMKMRNVNNGHLPWRKWERMRIMTASHKNIKKISATRFFRTHFPLRLPIWEGRTAHHLRAQKKHEENMWRKTSPGKLVSRFVSISPLPVFSTLMVWFFLFFSHSQIFYDGFEFWSPNLCNFCRKNSAIFHCPAYVFATSFENRRIKNECKWWSRIRRLQLSTLASRN